MSDLVPISKKALAATVHGALSPEAFISLCLVLAGIPHSEKYQHVSADSLAQAEAFRLKHLEAGANLEAGVKEALQGLDEAGKEEVRQGLDFMQFFYQEIAQRLKHEYEWPVLEIERIYQKIEGDRDVATYLIQRLRALEEGSGKPVQSPLGYIFKVLQTPLPALRALVQQRNTNANTPLISDALQQVIDHLPELPEKPAKQLDVQQKTLDGLKELGLVG